MAASIAAGLAAGALGPVAKSRRRACRNSRSRQVQGLRLMVAATGRPDAEEAGSNEDIGQAYPFSAVVGQDEMKLALFLNLVDPTIGGCLIQGDRGTGKSTAVRALTQMLPEIAVVQGDKYNSDPDDLSVMSDEAREKALAGEDLPVVMRRTPFVELPLGATEDRVTGTIDIERALLEGGKAFEPGILARVNRGILYIDECNLLDDQLVDVLLDSAAGGWNTVEREGVSVRHPARFVLIGTAHPDEGDLRPQLLDRFGMTVSIRTPMDAESRIQVLSSAVEYNKDPARFLARYAERDAALKAKVLDARGRLRSVDVPREIKVKVSTLCSKLNVDGMRGDIVTNRAARALAAFEGRSEVVEEDVRRVGVMCLQHRLRKDAVSDQAENIYKVVEEMIRVFGQGPPPIQAVEISETVAA